MSMNGTEHVVVSDKVVKAQVFDRSPDPPDSRRISPKLVLRVDDPDLAPTTQTSRIAPRGTTLYTQKSPPLGGLLSRHVPAGTGYYVRRASDGKRSAPLVVHTADAAPWNPCIYSQTIKPGGYQYL